MNSEESNRGSGYPAIPADEPKTDREWLMNIAKDIKLIMDKIKGKDGLCERLTAQEKEITIVKENYQKEINKLKRNQQAMIYLQIGIILLILGRYAFGPTSWPLVP